jgi:hypothetical protein
MKTTKEERKKWRARMRDPDCLLKCSTRQVDALCDDADELALTQSMLEVCRNELAGLRAGLARLDRAEILARWECGPGEFRVELKVCDDGYLVRWSDIRALLDKE